MSCLIPPSNELSVSFIGGCNFWHRNRTPTPTAAPTATPTTEVPTTPTLLGEPTSPESRNPTAAPTPVHSLNQERAIDAIMSVHPHFPAIDEAVADKVVNVCMPEFADIICRGRDHISEGEKFPY